MHLLDYVCVVVEFQSSVYVDSEVLWVVVERNWFGINLSELLRIKSRTIP